VTLLAVREGGVDVESHAAADALRVVLHPLADRVPAFAVRSVASTWGVPATAELAELLDTLWRLFRREDCVLLEVNPLGCDTSGRLVALDARVELDASARFRHPEREARHDGSAFETGCAAVGVVGAELGGDIAIVTSGAGLGMATLDLVTDAGATAACVVDLGGAVFRPEGVVSEVIRLVAELRPRVILLNCLLQLASFDALAEAVASGLREADRHVTLVVRCASGHRATAADALAAFSPTIHDDLASACADAAGVSSGVPG
jgi:succinyl-CoA synthetase beta subunit